jgi:uncharacterized membrane protein YgdD (TMEM256/DUF423 family)
MSYKSTLVLGSIILAFAVIIGAFGAHALKTTLVETGKEDVFKTAVQYHFYHGFALLFVGILLMSGTPNDYQYLLKLAAYAFCLGILLFCGSLYVLSLTGITKLGMIAPIGGLSFILGWLLCAYYLYKS